MKREFDINGIQYTFKDGSTLYVKADKELQLSIEQAMSYWEASGVTENISSIYFPSLLEEMLEFSKKQVEEEKEYFIPKVNDFKPDYECEVLTNRGWREYIIYSSKAFIDDIVNNSIRTPYLTQEQIEKEGWTKIKAFIGYEFKKGNLKLRHSIMKIKQDVVSTFLHIYDTKYDQTLYIGQCLSINEFRTIMKLLNIK